MIELNNELTSSFNGLDQLFLVYQELEETICSYKDTTNLACISQCSKCCNKSAENIEVTIFEMIPLSIFLWQNRSAEETMEKLNCIDSTASCIMFNPSSNTLGGCSCYQWRPLLCRLFGFSAILDKNQSPTVSMCKYMKEINPYLEKEIQEEINKGLIVPINSQFAHKISLINPTLGQKRYPINKALSLALEMVGFRMSLLGLINPNNNNDDDNFDNTPPKPRGTNYSRSA
ncbi:YkgJ family cysteine cluster protein [Alkaliphilus transvaalensis]|uniref:YkgJ family cysteine cluster protein n=1 Tax=Alkaliphilus transvaalensis TaxID=114628 RepID=UPI000686C632|nr:YkgJ family cysteine cluster protein [Alkaliphilus transvaalensis]